MIKINNVSMRFNLGIEKNFSMNCFPESDTVCQTSIQANMPVQTQERHRDNG